MTKTTRQTLAQRIGTLGVSQDALATVAGVFGSDVSRHVRGIRISQARQSAIDETLDVLEELVRTPNALVPNMRKPESIRAALANLAKIRAKETTPHRALVFKSPATA